MSLKNSMSLLAALASYFRPDNVHLSPRGYGLLARLVLQEMGK